MGRNTSVARHTGTQGWVYAGPDAWRPKKSQREDTYVRVFLHGTVGTILWGHHPAAEISAWRIRKNEQGAWTLTATATVINHYQCRQTQLLFTAPKPQGPPWCWNITSLDVETNQIRATLGQPLQ